jgi:hypothetical protein
MWCLATTLAGIEFKTSDQLAAAGVEVYVPVYTKRIKPRRVRSFRTITLPLLPRYLMVSTDDIGRDRLRIRERTGQLWFATYQDVSTRERKYIHMQGEDIAGLKAREAAGEWDNLTVGRSCEIRVGEQVFCVALDRRGIVVARLSSERARVQVVYIVGCAGVPTFGRLVEVDDVTLCGEFGRQLAGVAGMHTVVTC